MASGQGTPHKIEITLNQPQQAQTVADDLAHGSAAHGSDALERAAREASAQADASRYHYAHAQADALASFSQGGFEQGISRLFRKHITDPVYDGRNADSQRESLYRAGVTPDMLDDIALGNAPGIEGVNSGLGSGRGGIGIPGLGSLGMWGEMGKRAAVAGFGHLMWGGVKSAMQDDAELDAANLGVSVSRANMTGFLSLGSGRYGDSQREDSDNMSYMGLLRYMNRSDMGSLSAGEANEVISGISSSFAGNRGAGDDALPSLLRARMAGIGEGGSVAFLNQGASGGGGDNVSGQMLERVAGALQELGISGAKSGHLLERIADNTLQLSMNGIRTDAEASAGFLTSVARTPGLENLGGRADDLGMVLQSGAASVRSKLVGSFSPASEIAQWVALAKRGGNLEEMISGVEEAGGDRQQLMEDYQNNLPGGLGVLGLSAAGFSMSQAKAAMGITRSAATSVMRTSRDSEFAETNQGQNVYDQKKEITGRLTEKVDLVLSPAASSAVEGLNETLNGLNSAFRDVGGEMIRALSSGTRFTGDTRSMHKSLPGGR